MYFKDSKIYLEHYSALFLFMNLFFLAGGVRKDALPGMKLI